MRVRVRVPEGTNVNKAALAEAIRGAITGTPLFLIDASSEATLSAGMDRVAKALGTTPKPERFGPVHSLPAFLDPRHELDEDAVDHEAITASDRLRAERRRKVEALFASPKLQKAFLRRVVDLTFPDEEEADEIYSACADLISRDPQPRLP
jgi:hypothetical protein